EISISSQIPSVSPQKSDKLIQKEDSFSVKKPITAIILARNNEYVPEPIAWIPNSINEEEALGIATKGLILILGDTDKVKECYSLIHFLKRKQIGLIYLFEIPNRTKLTSATLSILFEEDIKKVIFTNIEEMEIEIKKFLDKNRKNFDFSNEKLKFLHDIIITILEKPLIKYEKITPLQKLDSKFDLKNAMMKEIKKFQEPKKIEKKIEKSNLESEMVRAIKNVKNEV
ncbi:MAG: hypothetical protein ACFFCM_16200, partial [Promethearchaeota archaeon]